MAFTTKLGSFLRQSITKHASASSSIQSLYQPGRFMSSRVFVGGLSYGVDDQTLRESFSTFGDVTDAKIINDRETGRSRGFGFVTFTSAEEANAAIEGMDGKDLHGRAIRVNLAQERNFGGGGGGGYGSGGFGGGGRFGAGDSSAGGGF
uniref:TSA: Wollemia nobilis Ref_Wollemi_Transcript_10199_1024 transcribed RNA sequence n=1 Tax=Wollemia nobilis TaxID=56998 RepID=A0A0C9S8X8_9CONI